MHLPLNHAAALHLHHQTHPAGEQPGPVRAVKGADPSTWIEHYRVSWALWHLQRFSDLKQTAQSRWTWSPTSLAELDRCLVWNGIWDRRSNARAEQIWTIAAVLGDLGLHPEYQTPDLSDLGLEGARAWLIRPVQEEPTLEPPLALWGYPPGTTAPFFPSF